MLLQLLLPELKPGHVAILVQFETARDLKLPGREWLLERNFKTERLKTGNVATGTSTRFRPLYTPNYCPFGRVSFDTHAFHDYSLSVRRDEELTHNAGW